MPRPPQPLPRGFYLSQCPVCGHEEYVQMGNILNCPECVKQLAEEL